MHNDEQTFGSTTWGWRRAKMSRPPEASKENGARAGRSAFRKLPRWEWRRRPLPMTVKFRGGSECWFEIHSRGRSLRVPGHEALYDVMRTLTNNDR